MIRLSDTRALVTGGTGLLSSHIVEDLRQSGCADAFVARRSGFDLTSSAAIARLFRMTRADLLVHTAGVVGGTGASLLFSDVIAR